MEAKFWHERWQKQQIGFHLDEVNPLLTEFEEYCLKTAPIFVPLCGKSSDMLYLAQKGYRVTGVELSERALRDFQSESSIELEEQKSDGFIQFCGNNLHLYCGDFFKLTSNNVDSIHQVYDRAALIALPPHMRQDYVNQLLTIMPRPLSIMLITLSYPQEQMKGPPFSVPDEEVRSLFHSAKRIERLHYTSILEKEDRFRQKGLTELHEAVYHIQF